MSNNHQQSEGKAKTAAEIILRSLWEHGVQYIFANFGTDHTPLLEAASSIRQSEDEGLPQIVICPHESVALSAAHGYAAATGKPQAVIVHVDVGTQNLGAMIHNAHRGDAPVFIISGLAPVSAGKHPGARDSFVHYLQDVENQPGIVRQYCRWTNEYRPPADPDALIVRGLEIALTARAGPVYLTASREALETPVDTALGTRTVDRGRPTAADAATIDNLASRIEAAQAPLVITSKLATNGNVNAIEDLVSFSEAAGAGVVEQSPAVLNFPRTHDLHVGYRPDRVYDAADLLVLLDTDIPWLPGSESAPSDDIPVIQIDVDPKKPTYPHWDFSVDEAVQADPAKTVSLITEQLDPANGEAGRTHWRQIRRGLREEVAETLADHRSADQLTAEVLSASLANYVTEDSIIVNETTTNTRKVLDHLDLEHPGSYFASHGSGLGWAPGAAIGVKLARPDASVFTLVGDGSYVFANPTAVGWMAEACDAPTLTVIYNNSGWNAVRESTLREHPDGNAAESDVPESKFTPTLDLSHAAQVVDAYTNIVDTIEDLDLTLDAACRAVDSGKPAVLDVRIEPI